LSETPDFPADSALDVTPQADEATRPSERGFTLVELMVVVAIIALIATIIIPNYVHSRQQAAAATSEANLKEIATSLELYYADNYHYPNKTGANVDPTAIFGAANNQYLAQSPVDPVSGTGYVYTVGPNQESYTLDAPGTYDATTLSNVRDAAGQPGTGDQFLHYSPQVGLYKSTTATGTGG